MEIADFGIAFDPIAEATLLGSQFHPHFTADPGVYERLEVEDIPLRQNPDGTFKLYFGAFNYNPHVYTLITKDQVRYTYDQFEGLLSISDRNDVRLTYTDTGITSSIGQSITWTRDTFGRSAALLAALLLTLHRTHIHMSQEVRMYALLWMLYSIALPKKQG